MAAQNMHFILSTQCKDSILALDSCSHWQTLYSSKIEGKREPQVQHFSMMPLSAAQVSLPTTRLLSRRLIWKGPSCMRSALVQLGMPDLNRRLASGQMPESHCMASRGPSSIGALCQLIRTQ